MELFLIGWKNVFRNKRRSIMNIIALSIGIILMIIFQGWMRGYFTSFYDTVIRMETGHLQILQKEYQAQQRRHPLDLTVKKYREKREEISARPEVAAVTGRINFTARISNGKDSVFVEGKAIDPENESHITEISSNIVEGTFLAGGEGVLIGKPLAEKLGVKVGDQIWVTAVDKYSIENPTRLPLEGIYSMGSPPMDNNMIFTNLETADFMLDLDDEVTRLVVKVKPGHSYEALAAQLNDELKDTPLAAYIWKEFAKVVVSAVEGDASMFGVMGVVIYIFIILGILNSISMSIHERTREIGTIRAIGMKRKSLILLFVYEGLGLAIISIITALIISGILGYYLQTVGFDLKDFMPEDIAIPFGDRFTTDFRWYDFLTGALVGGITTVAGSIIPAARGAKITIARAMGTAHLE